VSALLLVLWTWMSPMAAVDSEIELRVGQTAAVTVAGKEMSIRFVRVIEDSRCPIGVNCVWEGDAVARFELTAGGAAETVDLHTHHDRERARDVGEARVSLTQLTPVPRADKHPKPDEYVATLVVEARR
jgi:hypothetical protein